MAQAERLRAQQEEFESQMEERVTGVVGRSGKDRDSPQPLNDKSAQLTLSDRSIDTPDTAPSNLEDSYPPNLTSRE